MYGREGIPTKIDTTTDFLDLIEYAFRAYKPGMREHIRKNLAGISCERLEELYNIILKWHEKDSSPKYSEIVKLANRHGLSLRLAEDKLGLFHCKNCGALYVIADSAPVNCTNKIGDQFCGSNNFDTRILTPSDQNYSFYLSQTRKILKKEAEESRQKKNEYFSKKKNN